MFFYTENTYRLCDFDTADKICEAALSLFSQQGFFNTSIHHIQKESKVSIGSIYHHFGNKKAIASVLHAKILEQMDFAFIDIMSQHQSFQEKYLNIIKLLFTMVEKEPRTMKFIFHSNYSEYSNLNKSVFQLKPFRRVNNEIINSCKNDVIKQRLHSVDLTMAILFSLPIRLIQLRLDKIIIKSITNQTDIIFKIVWEGFCAEYQGVSDKKLKEIYT